jgi:hypothetical protein
VGLYPNALIRNHYASKHVRFMATNADGFRIVEKIPCPFSQSCNETAMPARKALFVASISWDALALDLRF